MVKVLANACVLAAGLLWGIELIPQVMKTIKTKNVEGISIAFFMTCLSAYVLYMVGNILLHNWMVVIAHIPSLILNGIMARLIYKYRRVT